MHLKPFLTCLLVLISLFITNPVCSQEVHPHLRAKVAEVSFGEFSVESYSTGVDRVSYRLRTQVTALIVVENSYKSPIVVRYPDSCMVKLGVTVTYANGTSRAFVHTHQCSSSLDPVVVTYSPGETLHYVGGSLQIYDVTHDLNHLPEGKYTFQPLLPNLQGFGEIIEMQIIVGEEGSSTTVEQHSPNSESIEAFFLMIVFFLVLFIPFIVLFARRKRSDN